MRVDIKKIGLLLLPTLLRRHKLVAWIRVLLTPIDTLHHHFHEKRTADLYNLSHNGQKCYLRKALNDAFDPNMRRITIGEAARNNAVYIYTEGENLPVYLGEPFYLFTDGEYVGRINFVVRVPKALEHLDLQIRVLIDYYKLATKKYEIYYE